MPDKQVRKDLDDMLKTAPTQDEAGTRLTVTGAVMKSKSDATFMLRGTDGRTVELNRDAVEKFDVLSSGPGERTATLVLNEAALPDDIRDILRPGGGFKYPIETLKEPPSDTIKETPFDTLKEVGGGDTRKELPFDTLKETGGGDTIKELPIDTLKETGGGDTTKEGTFDTLKELGGDTAKEGPFDTLKEVGGGDTTKEGTFDTLKELNADTIKELGGDTLKEATGDQTWVEQPELPGQDLGGLVQPRAAMMGPQAAMQANDFTAMRHPFTLKEVPWDGTFKEIGKDAMFDGTGIMDSLVEGRPDWGQYVNPAVNPGVPFVLATPHQASQGAVAQQMLAAQALQGRLGF